MMQRRLLIAVIFALPLFTAFGPISYFTFNLRVTVVLVAALACLVYWRQALLEPLKRLPRATVIALCLFTILSVLSSLHSIRYYTHAALLGADSDQLGLCLWLSFLLLGVAGISVIRRILISPKLLYVLLPVGMLSLWVGRFDIGNGLRLGGLLFQSTGLAIYGCLAMIVAFTVLYRQRDRTAQVLGWLTLIVYAGIIVLTQSRVGWLCLVLILLANGWGFARKNWQVTGFAVALLLVLVVLPLSFRGYFGRYREASVASGSSYRLELYKASSSEVLHHDLLLGKGTDTIPPALNNRRTVPEDIAKTLDQGFVFVSAHNIFIDIAYYFGVVASLTLVYIIGSGLYAFYQLRDRSLESLNYLLLFVTLLLNALINVPTIELTPLFFIVLFGLFGAKPHGKKH